MYNLVRDRFRRFRLTLLLPLAALGAALFAPPAPAQVRPDRQTGETQLFGVIGRGSRFVFVFDRSLSMKGAPLAAAKRELIASLSRLERVHQFQIVFYNESPRLMRLAGGQSQMHFADEDGLKAAESFIGGITAAGGTDHVQALKLALRLGPDVVFFLTDADEPVLTAKELDEIWRASGGSIINVIEFKPGPDRGQGDFLRKLAEQNRGQYKYVDTTTLAAEP